jgi:hypothetical protein
MHIAESVVNRILNAADDVQSVQNAPPSLPNSPNIQQQGAALDAAVAQPVGDVAPIEGIEDAIPLRALDL